MGEDGEILAVVAPVDHVQDAFAGLAVSVKGVPSQTVALFTEATGF